MTMASAIHPLRSRGWLRASLAVAALVAWTTTAHASGDGPEISRSRGKVGGAVVLWPRVVPETDDPAILAVASKLQSKLAAMAARGVSESRNTVRPAPERVCPQSGCKGVSLGVMLAHKEGGCAAIAIVGAPLQEGASLVPWAGKFDLKSNVVNFRQPPEAVTTVKELVSCNQLLSVLDDAPVLQAIGNVAG